MLSECVHTVYGLLYLCIRCKETNMLNTTCNKVFVGSFEMLTLACTRTPEQTTSELVLGHTEKLVPSGTAYAPDAKASTSKFVRIRPTIPNWFCAGD